jgi:hypothetical protein
MASTYTPLGIEIMATGENSGTWGTKTNTNLEIFEQITGGYLEVSIASTPTTLTQSDGATGSAVATRVLQFTGTISGATVVTMPVLTENFYLIKNASTGAYTVELKAASGSGATVTWSATDKDWKLVYFDGVTTNTGVYDLGLTTSANIQTLTNKTLTAPKIGTSILDTNGNELFLLTATASAVNELTYANAATGNNPAFTATGGDTNIGLNLVPKGTGVLQGAGSALKIAGLETMWVPASAMYGATTNPADAQQVETTATRPDMKVLDFDASTDEFAQFSVAFPKSWNEGTITYQSISGLRASTNTGDCIFGLQGVAIGDGDTIDVAYGTAVQLQTQGLEQLKDQQVSAVSSAITIAGSPAVDQQTYFQLYRDANAGGDTFTGDARVLGIKIFYTTDAANDA